MLRTPPKTGNTAEKKSPMASNATFSVESASSDGEVMTSNNVRRSIGEWESGTPDPRPNTKASPAKKSAPSKKGKATLPSRDRIAEARAWVVKAKTNLGDSRNISTVIKNQVILAIDRLYALIKESESDKGQGSTPQESCERKDTARERETENEALIKTIEEHKILIKENTQKVEELKEALEKKTYASVAADPVGKTFPERTALHSVVVTGKNEIETGEQILDRIREAVDAKEGWVTVERVRKAKDRKVIMGCKTEEEKKKLKDRLSKASEHLNVEDIKNKDPLIIMRDVLQIHSDETIVKALRKQNVTIFEGLNKSEDRVEIKYRRRTKNPHTCHIVARVSAKIWQRVTRVEAVHIDLQRIRVADQSPLVQCSMCLGYGHGRRFCKEALEKCSHCGGPHKKAECADWLAGAVPTCCNCQRNKADRVEHNAFSSECPVRQKWDELARATVAYS